MSCWVKGPQSEMGLQSNESETEMEKARAEDEGCCNFYPCVIYGSFPLH